MEDDFFSDLVPIKPTNGSKAAAPPTSSGSNAFAVDSVLSALPDAKAPREPASAEQSPAQQHAPPLLPMGEPRHKKEAREMESSMQAMLEATFKRFAGGLTNVLEDINRWVLLPPQICYVSQGIQSKCHVCYAIHACRVIAHSE